MFGTLQFFLKFSIYIFSSNSFSAWISFLSPCGISSSTSFFIFTEASMCQTLKNLSASFALLTRTLVIGFRARSSHIWLHFNITNYICKGSISKSYHNLRSWWSTNLDRTLFNRLHLLKLLFFNNASTLSISRKERKRERDTHRETEWRVSVGHAH